MAGLYLHIPFCESRCIYCGFFSSTLLEEREHYVDALCKEMVLKKDYLEEPVSTIYLGGGTPSMLTASQLAKLFQQIYRVFSITSDTEVTLECNPDDVTDAFAQMLTALPVNRISMGAQTFSDERLRFLRRRHKATDVHQAIRRLRHVGIDNISIDLMFGFPDETLADWECDITEALFLHVEHLSAYSLMYEEGTPLFRLLQQGRVSEIDEELYRQMYDMLIDRLAAAGYEHYEISNFARPGRHSRHNSSYWTAVPYLGLGAAAHSYDHSTRSWNVADITQYIQAIHKGRLPQTVEQIDAATRYDDLIVTALRTREGIDLSTMETPQAAYLLRCAKPFLNHGELQLSNHHLRLTRQGIYISDSIMADLMWDE